MQHNYSTYYIITIKDAGNAQHNIITQSQNDTARLTV